MRTSLIAACAIVLVSACLAQAQTPMPRRFAIDSVVSVDDAAATTLPRTTGIAFDTFVSVRLARHLDFVAQPIARRLPNGMWLYRFYQLGLRYERPGPVAVRAEVGEIMSPLGLGTLQARAHLNPTLGLPASYYLTLPAVEPGAPRLEMMSPGYPMGGLLTVTAGRWDARAAVLDSSPLRYRHNVIDKTVSRAPQVMSGVGYTVQPGFRLGAAVSQGRYAKAGEYGGTGSFDRHATILAVEGEYAIGYTKLSGEWVRASLETAGARAVAQSWFVQAQRTLTPRWFVASRLDRVASSDGLRPGRPIVRLSAAETVVGYRLNPDITLRAGYVTRRPFRSTDGDHQFGLSLVWNRRWW